MTVPIGSIVIFRGAFRIGLTGPPGACLEISL